MHFSLFAVGRIVIGSLALAAGIVGSAVAQTPPARLKLLVGFQDATLPETVTASRVLEGASYDVEWVILPGPAAQLTALYSKAIDIGHMGDTSLIIEQGKAQSDWTPETVPLQIIAGWRANDVEYPPIVTVARVSSNIDTLADLRGKKWAYNFGGFNYLQYVRSLAKATLTTADIEPVQLGDQNATAAALNSGRVDVYSGSIAPVAEGIGKGLSKVLLTSDELDIPALNVFTARGDVVHDPAKREALKNFIARLRSHWNWYGNNLDAVEKIYIEKVKQTPSYAKLTTHFLNARLQQIDDALIQREQRIADVLFDAGGIRKKINVAVEFNRDFVADAGN